LHLEKTGKNPGINLPSENRKLILDIEKNKSGFAGNLVLVAISYQR